MSGDYEEKEKLTRGALLLQDNSPAHTSQVDMASVTKCSFEVLPHLPYSPDLAPSDFHLFSNLKTNLRSANFGSNRGILDTVDEYLGDQEESKLEQRWNKVHQIKGR